MSMSLFFNKFWMFPAIISWNFFSLSLLSDNPIIHVLVYLMMSHISLRLLFLCVLSSLGSSACMIYLSPSSFILSLASSYLSLSPSNEFFILSVFQCHNFHLVLFYNICVFISILCYFNVILSPFFLP